jgi:hypothetical protein
VPLAGVKTYRYAFVSSKPGTYELPAASFSFFDPDTNTYKTLKTDSKRVAVSTRERVNTTVVEARKEVRQFSKKPAWIAAGIVVLVGITVLIYWISRKKETPPVKTTVAETITRVSIDEILKPAWLLVPAADKDFYTLLHRIVWNFLSEQFKLSGSELNKQTIYNRVNEWNSGSAIAGELLDILGKCEAGMFTNADMGENKEEVLAKVKMILEAIRFA